MTSATARSPAAGVGRTCWGLLHGNLLMGLQLRGGGSGHNKHHSNPNHLEKDSDITRRRHLHPGAGTDTQGKVKQFIVRHQHVLFYPLLTTEGIGLRTESLKALRRRLPRLNTVEAVLIAVHLVAYFTTIFTVMTVGQGVAFVLTMNLLFGSTSARSSPRTTRACRSSCRARSGTG
jgi:fatty acid desaturase